MQLAGISSNCSDCIRVVRVQGESAEFISINEHFNAEMGQHECNVSSDENIT